MKFISSRLLFGVTLIILSLTIIFVWFFGLGKHRTMFENTMISSWILTTVLFQFLFVGLYMGFKLKENIGRIEPKPFFKLSVKGFFKDLVALSPDVSGLIPFGDSPFEIILIFFLSAGLIIVILAYISATLFPLILIFIAILYLVFYRAIKFAFKKSKICKGQVFKSLAYSFLFTLTYSIWYYIIVLGVHYLNSK